MFPLGEVASLAAAACWAIGLNLFRRDARDIGPRQVNFFKGAFAALLLLVCLLFIRPGPIATGDQAYLAISGIIGIAVGDSLLFYALAHLGAHRAALFGTLGPVLTAAGAWTFLGEDLSGRQFAGLFLAAGGVAMVVYHRSAEPATRLGLLLGFLSAACQATGVLLAKRGLVDADPLAATTLRIVAATAALAVFALFRGVLQRDCARLVRKQTLRRLMPAAFFGTFLGLWFMTTGIKHTKSAIASALHSTTPLFTLPISLFVLRERVTVLAVTGSFLAVGGVFLLFL